MKSNRSLLVLCLLISYTYVCGHNRRPDDTTLNPEQSMQADLNTPSQQEGTPLLLQDSFPLFQKLPSGLETDDEVTHGPLGGVCADLVSYYEYFADHFMSDASQKPFQQTMKLFCNTMLLMSDLADKQYRNIRIDTYINDLIGVIRTIYKTAQERGELAQLQLSSPTLYSLFSAADQKENTSDAHVDLGIEIHDLLRARKTGQPLIADIFDQLHTYASQHINEAIAHFHQDTQTLLVVNHDKPLTFSAAHGRLCKQQSWMCKAAARACQEFEHALPQDTFLEQSHDLMEILHSLLDAMHLTYSRLSSEKPHVRVSDREAVASRFALIIHLLPFKETRASVPTTSFYLTQCQKLGTLEDQVQFVAEAFEQESDRFGLLEEFFPTLEDSLENNLSLLMRSLSDYTIQTFEERYWLTPQ